MNPLPARLVIYIKDAALITGQSERSARRLLNRIRKHFNRPSCSFISLHDFCSFTGLPRDEVKQFLMY